MAYTDEQWDNVMAFLQDEAEKPAPDGIGKTIDTTEEFVEMLRITEAIRNGIANGNAAEQRDFARVEAAKNAADQSVIDLQDELDNHPGNPRRP